MDYDNIELLLEKYFDGNTTITEESVLKKYFLSSHVTVDLNKYKSIFEHYKNERDIVYKHQFVVKSKKSHTVWFAAAAIILLAGLCFVYYNSNNQANLEQGLGSYQSPEIALKQTQKALQMLSSNVNIGIGSIAYINEYQTAKNKIFVE